MNRPVLILDFGGVISRTLFETHSQSERALGLPAGSLTWQGPFAPHTDLLWRRMQAGELSERDYWRQRAREVGAMLGEQWTDMQTLVIRARGAEPTAVIRPEAIAAVDSARKAGVRLAILSNELDLFYGEALRTRLPLLERFECIVDATHTGILKPDPRAYLDCAARLAVPPERCVFVDDQDRNVIGAQAVGMTAIAFDVRDPAGSYACALRALGLDS